MLRKNLCFIEGWNLNVEIYVVFILFFDLSWLLVEFKFFLLNGIFFIINEIYELLRG